MHGTNPSAGASAHTAGQTAEPFYYHAMGYPPCNETGAVNGCNSCIYGKRNSLLVYTSPDLSSGSWDLVDTVYPAADSNWPNCTYFRTQAVYNPSTKLYILWANTAGCAPKACGLFTTCASYAMGVAKSPAGPFKFVGTSEPTPSSLGPIKGFKGDYALFVDTDGSGYAIITHGIAGAGHRDMYIFRLTDDFLGFDSSTSGFSSHAPVRPQKSELYARPVSAAYSYLRAHAAQVICNHLADCFGKATMAPPVCGH